MPCPVFGEYYTGAATTSIPIVVPPGRKGIAPELSLNYNSQRGNGWIGVGWNLDMGEIQKSSKTGVDYFFILNGNTTDLIVRSEWGANYFGAKIEAGFLKYYYNTSIDSWEVTTKDGTKYYFGTTSASRQNNTNGTFRWFLDKVQDINGNYMTISYITDQGEIYLDRIDYTGNTDGLNPTNYIKFSLEPRNDAITRYNIGSEVITASRLRTIEVYGNGQFAKKYVLEYTYSPNSSYSLLSSVTLYGSDGVTALPPITFSYQTTENSFQFISSQINPYPQTIGDFNGDGKADYYANSKVFLSDGSSFTDAGMWLEYYSYYSPKAKAFAGDVNGDGKDDLIIFDIQVGPLCFQQPIPRLVKTVQISTGNSFQRVNSFTEWLYCYASTIPPVTIGDFNGDGKADYDINGSGAICYSNGSGFICIPGVVPAGTAVYAGDVNSDGKDDLIIGDSSQISLYFSKGNSYFQFMSSESSSDYPVTSGNFNGDDKVDYIKSSGSVCYSNGGSFNCVQGIAPTGTAVYAGDVNSDGKDDLIIGDSSLVSIYTSTGPIPSLLSSIDNGFGGTTTITYAPSSQYTNTYLPFVGQTLSSVTVGDGNGNLSTTNYTYSGGLFDYVDREFRGFEYVKATLPKGTTTETWFKQDDIFKGLPYEQITKDSSDNIYTKTINTYQSTSPYTGVDFPFLRQKDDEVYDGTITPKQARTEFWYDGYGNITRKYLYGDVSVSGDERDENTEYYLPGEVGEWIVSLPKTVYVKDNTEVIKAQKWYTYYSGTGNLWKEESWLEGGVNPVTTYEYDSYGNVWKITDPKNNPPTIITYDTTTYTYPTTVQNPLGHTIQKTYDYRFGKVLTDTDPNGNLTTYEYDVFGRIKKVTNPNDTASAYGTMSYYYLNFGTVGTQKILTYATEQSGTANYIWTEAYFDGLGRTITTRTEGPDSKVIAQQTLYDNRGQVSYASLPYFEGIETERWTYFEYDPIGRVKKVTNPDGTFVTKDYLRGRTTLIDANGHQKIEEKDVYGRLINVEEYFGVSPSSMLYATTTYQYDVLGNLIKVIDANNNQTSITYDTLSRKTSMDDPDMGHWEYQYDANGNLIYQKDAKNQEITFEYDALNRIKKKNYPDTTFVEYKYDEAFSTNSKGRLTTLIDSSGTEKYYYDKLGRTIKTVKTIDAVDNTIETTYDSLGRIETIKYPDNTPIKYEYDTGGNLSKVKNISNGTVYATYSNYNALGQHAATTFANGVTTQYQYYPLNNRLSSIKTTRQTTNFMDVVYEYDNARNIKKITDYLDSTKTRSFVYDDLNRLIEANSQSYGGNILYQYDKIGNMTYNCRYGYYYYDDPLHKHAVTRVVKNGTTIDTYIYDDNGNMTSGAGRTFTYDYDNRPTSITYNSMVVISVYDAGGNRVKKVTPTLTTIYIGKLYECTNGECTKYIIAGSERIANIKGIETYYYHSDHLGSSNIITDTAGNKVEDIFYYPYGEMKFHTGSINVRHKFTGQEYDAESGLYYYGARYYDPLLGRFISADSIVQNFSDPQTLNRYSYARNNPIIYTDPTGHFWWIVVGAIVGAVSAGAQSDWDVGAMLQGAVIGAVSGAVGGAVGGYVGGAMSSASYSATVSSVIAGSAGGMAAGATSAALTGGNIGQGALIGAFAGGIGGYVGYAIRGWGDVYQGLAQVGTGGVVGGTVSELTGGTFWEGFRMGAISGAVAFWTTKIIEYLEIRPLAEGEADKILRDYTGEEVKQYPEQNIITKDIHTLRKQLQTVYDKHKVSTFWKTENQIRIGRYDTKFYEYKNEAWSSIDIVDVNVNPIGHFFCDYMRLCH